MDRVWIVMGQTGEYSDRTEWPVIAFTSKEAAEARIKALDEKMQQMPQEWRDNRWQHDAAIRAHMLPLDPTFSIDYTGTNYFYYEVEVAPAVTPASQQ